MNRFCTVVASLALIVAFSSASNATEIGAQYGFQSLGLSPAGFIWGASAISDVGVGDELVVVGGEFLPAGSRFALRWTETAGTEVLFNDPNFGAIANDVSADGTVVVGVDAEAFRWTEADGVQYLGLLPGGANFSRALGVTRDGSVIVGTSESATIGTAYRWDEDNLIEPLSTTVPLIPSIGSNFAAHDAVIAADGTLWSVGESNLDGGASQGVIWRDDIIIHNEPDAFGGRARIPAVGNNNEMLVMPVNRSIGGFQGEFGFEVFSADVSSETVVAVNQGLAQTIPPDILAFGYRATDISSDGSVIVGSAAIFGEDNGTVLGLPGVRSEPHIWEQESRIWGSSASSTPSQPENADEFRYVNLYELLQENLPISQQANLTFDDWALNEAVGVTVQEIEAGEAPLLGVPVFTSVVVGNGIAPNGTRMPWTATVHNAPGLQLEDLPERDLFNDGDFAGDGSQWTESGDGTFEVISNPVGEGTVGRLTTDTEFGISQLVETPDSPFVIAFDMLFTTEVGSFQIALDGVLLEEIFAPTTLGSELVTVPVLVVDSALLGRTDIPLSVTAFGGSTGQVLIDNVAIASIAVPEPSTFAILLFGIVSASAARRYGINGVRVA